MTNRYALLLLILAGLGGCAQSVPKPASPPHLQPAALSPSLTEMFTCITADEKLLPQQRHRLRETLEQQLPDAGIAGRIRLACLLGRAESKDAELVRAIELLETLQQEQAFNSEQRMIIALYQRNLELIQRLRQQRRETREYRNKIEQIKGLEEELEPDAVRLESTP